MAKQEGPITTGTLAGGPPPKPEDRAPAAPPAQASPPAAAAAPAAKPAAAKPAADEYRVLVRHSPLVTRYKSLVVKAPSKEAAWDEYQKELERLFQKEASEGLGKNKDFVLKMYDKFKEWLGQQPPFRIPPSVEILPEGDHQKLRAEIRAKGPQPVKA